MTKRDYFVNEKKLSEVVANQLIKKLEKYADISDGFDFWLNSREYTENGALIVEGYSANAIHELAPHLDGAGVFSFLVTLREDPVYAKQIIESGFSQK